MFELVNSYILSKIDLNYWFQPETIIQTEAEITCKKISLYKSIEFDMSLK